MKKHRIFYDHLIFIEEVVAVIDARGLSAPERKALVELAEDTIHHEVLDTILTHLPRDRHADFLARFHRQPHNRKLLAFLRTHAAENIEEAIRTRIRTVADEIIADVRQLLP